MTYQQGGKYKDGRHAEAYGIDRHDRPEGGACGEHEAYPGKPYAADAAGRQTGGDKRDAKAAHVSRHYIAQKTEGMGQYDQHKAGIAYSDDVEVVVEDREYLPAEQEDQCGGGRQTGYAFGKTEGKGLAATKKILRRIFITPDAARAIRGARVSPTLRKMATSKL